MKLLLGTKIGPQHVEKLLAVGDEFDMELEIVASIDPAGLAEEVEDAEILVTWWSNFEPTYVTRGKNLKWIQTLTAGVDNFLLPEISERGISLTSLKGIHGIPMSEHMMGMLLGVTRGLYILHDQQQAKKWEHPRVEELYDQTMVILGLGNIGMDLAKRAKAFGMRVVGVKRTAEPVAGIDKVYGTDQLLEAVQEGDVVVSILPLTPSTHHLIDAEVFTAMKKEAFFMSFGRGDVVDQGAMTQALQEKEIQGAILDVFEDEPLAADSPLWEMDNVYISPHMSALSTRYMERAIEMIAENLRRYLAKESLLNVVDFEKGY